MKKGVCDDSPNQLRLVLQPIKDQVPKGVQYVGDQHKLGRIKLHGRGVRQQLGALDRNLQRLDPLVRVPGVAQLMIQLLNLGHILVLGQIQHLPHRVIVKIVQLLEPMLHLIRDGGGRLDDFTAGQEAGDDGQLFRGGVFVQNGRLAVVPLFVPELVGASAEADRCRGHHFGTFILGQLGKLIQWIAAVKVDPGKWVWNACD